MAVPKQRHTKSRRNKRRSHLSLNGPTLTKCEKCGRLILPHTVCPYCGFYKGREVVNVMAKLDKKEKKKREKEIKEKEKEGKKKQKPVTLEDLSRKKF
ncbi:50S ribosomal protein L32 [bacterium]|nr:50S ribosomal protein L32 [bacterium]